MQLRVKLYVIVTLQNSNSKNKSKQLKVKIMNSKISYLAILLVAFLFTTPLQAKEEMREVSAFSKIALRISAKVYVVQGERQSVKIVAEPETLEEIITEVKDRTLNIRYPNNNIFRNWNPGKVEVYITVPEVDGLTVSGSGDIESEHIKTRILDLAVSGSGNITIETLSAEKVDAAISGSGNVRLNNGGVADELKARISGSGNVNASGFEAQKVDVQTSGSGNCYVTSNGSLNVRVSGSGSVYYSGNPSIDSSISGSGKVKKR